MFVLSSKVWFCLIASSLARVLRTSPRALAHLSKTRAYIIRSPLHLRLVCRLIPVLWQLFHIFDTLRICIWNCMVQSTPSATGQHSRLYRGGCPSCLPRSIIIDMPCGNRSNRLLFKPRNISLSNFWEGEISSHQPSATQYTKDLTYLTIYYLFITTPLLAPLYYYRPSSDAKSSHTFYTHTLLTSASGYISMIYPTTEKTSYWLIGPSSWWNPYVMPSCGNSHGV